MSLLRSAPHGSDRLHKLLADHGLGSRREIERWMLEGRVLLNGKPVQPGERYRAGDRIAIDGRDVTTRMRAAKGPQVLIYHKPQGQPIGTPSADDGVVRAQLGAGAAAGPRVSVSVLESLPALRGARWLAINTMQAGDSGLLMLTSDGRLADALRRRAETTPAAYVARVLVPALDFDAAALPRAVRYDEETIEFESVEPAGGEGTNRWFKVESRRAHRRAAVRALFESQGLKVSRVIQLSFAGIELPRDLPRGRHRALSDAATAALYARAELEMPTGKDDEDTSPATRRRPPPDRRKSRAPGSRRSRAGESTVAATQNTPVKPRGGPSRGGPSRDEPLKSPDAGTRTENPRRGTRSKGPPRGRSGQPTGNRGPRR